jgi:outer membrane protein assembly factor BamE (lipoprotein component of BamABCDE complex)
MKKTELIGFLIIISLLVTIFGCASVTRGKRFDHLSVPKIEKGKSTQEDIVNLFGEPLTVRKTEKAEAWNYNMYELNQISTNKDRSLDVYFDKSGIVTDYKYSEVQSLF